jgi:hypothetical protein
MLDVELELLHLLEHLEVLGLNRTTSAITLGHEEITKDAVLSAAVAILAEVASSLMNILGSPEGSVGNVNVDCKSGASTARRGIVLKCVSSEQVEASSRDLHGKGA